MIFPDVNLHQTVADSCLYICVRKENKHLVKYSIHTSTKVRVWRVCFMAYRCMLAVQKKICMLVCDCDFTTEVLKPQLAYSVNLCTFIIKVNVNGYLNLKLSEQI